MYTNIFIGTFVVCTSAFLVRVKMRYQVFAKNAYQPRSIGSRYLSIYM